ncbi:MAG: 6-phosphofructokinase [Bacteroidetes bacterium]|nr:6-phosphofructokinase [Bacteroidota bacterium]MCH8246301.1 6-phosphofructokinase [Bacteroidota bacterium]
MNEVSTIGVFTSGGDAPGMNACIRSVVRTASLRGYPIKGIRRGYEGMIDGDIVDLDGFAVSSIIQTGGTILKSARSDRFLSEEGRQKAAEQIQNAGIDGLIAIGGDGTLAGALVFHEEHHIPCVACPGTIDNDLFGTDETIGFDTAINTALASIDRIRDTADAHNRLFLIEVMGRDAGFIAAHSGLAGGAEMVLIPETDTDIAEVKTRIHKLMTEHRRSSIVVIAEGDELGGAGDIADAMRADEKFDDIELRVCILGHTQRGGAPTARDRVLASRLGKAAVDALISGEHGVMAGVLNNELVLTPFDVIRSQKKTINREIIELNEIIS